MREETSSAIAVVAVIGIFGATVGLLAAMGIANMEARVRAEARAAEQVAMTESHREVEAAQLRVIQRLEQQLADLRCMEKEISK